MREGFCLTVRRYVREGFCLTVRTYVGKGSVELGLTEFYWIVFTEFTE